MTTGKKGVIPEACSHSFVVVSENNLGPTDLIMKMNGDSVWEIISECKHCGEIEFRQDV